MTKYIDFKPKNKDEWIDHDEQYMYESVSSISESSQLYMFSCYYPLDLANYIKDNGGEKKILADQAVKQYLENLKVTMLIQKLEETDLN